MTNVRSLLPAVLLILFGADALVAQARAPGVLQNAWTSPCTLDVVLVTFRDTTGMHMGGTVQADTFQTYSDYDLPHGYSVNSDGALEPGTSSYKMEDFRRLFGGGEYDYSVNGEPARRPAAFVGDTVHVADRTERLPEVFGSLRHYFHVISGGDFELRVRILNEEDSDGYPVWVQLPETKGYYADRAQTIPATGENEYWIHAYNATLDSVRAWYPGTTAYDPPDVGYSRERRLRHKVLYLYAGPSYSDPRLPRGLQSQIHPQADRITAPNPATAAAVGFRYVASERGGSGSDSHDADRFNTIGIHAHEVGHLLGFHHPGGRWVGEEVYTNRTATCANGLSFGGGRMAGWGTMQSGADGPVVEGRRPNSRNSYKYAFASCPNPFNPLYLRDLDWQTLNWDRITGTEENKPILPNRYYFIEGADDSEIAVELRTAEGFGRYVSWYRFDEAPGLMIWKRGPRAPLRQARLVPADNRSVVNSTRGCPPQPGGQPCTPATGLTGPITEGLTPRTFNSSTVYPWIDHLSDPFDAKEGNGLRSTFLPLPTHRSGANLPTMPTLARDDLRPAVTQATDDSHLQRNRYDCLSDDGPSRVAFRNIRVNRNRGQRSGPGRRVHELLDWPDCPEHHMDGPRLRRRRRNGPRRLRVDHRPNGAGAFPDAGRRRRQRDF